MKKLLIVGSIGISCILSSCSGSGSTVSNPEICESYISEAGECFKLCEKSKTYEYKNKQGNFEEITENVDHIPIDRWYIFDKSDTIIVEYPYMVDESYDYIYIAKDTYRIEWITFKKN